MLGIIIGERDCWGKGLATEAISLVTEYAFEFLNLNRVGAGCYEGNTASLKTFEKAGFKKGDIIVKVDKEDMLRVEDVINSIGSRSSGETVMIEVIRDGDRMKIKAELGSKAELNKYMIKRKLEKIKKIEVNTSDILEEKLERLEKELEEIKEMLRKD